MKKIEQQWNETETAFSKRTWEKVRGTSRTNGKRDPADKERRRTVEIFQTCPFFFPTLFFIYPPATKVLVRDRDRSEIDDNLSLDFLFHRVFFPFSFFRFFSFSFFFFDRPEKWSVSRKERRQKVSFRASKL